MLDVAFAKLNDYDIRRTKLANLKGRENYGIYNTLFIIAEITAYCQYKHSFNFN